MHKSKKSNHPRPGSRIKIEPVRDESKIRAIEESLADSSRNLAIFTIGIYTGIRPVDMLNLTVDQVCKAEISGELTYCEFQTGKLMQLQLPEKVRGAIHSWIETGWRHRLPNPRAPFFQGTKGPLKIPTINKLVKRWCQSVGIEGNFGALTLRKTYGYHILLEGKKSLKEIKHFFNHPRGKETLDYLCIPPEKFGQIRQNPESSHSANPTRRILERVAELEDEIKTLKQTALENSQANIFYKIIFENASDQIAIIDTNGIFLDVNEQAVDIFGFTRDEIVGKSIFDIEYLDSERMNELFLDFIHNTDNPKNKVTEYRGIRKDKSTVYFEVSSRPVYENGEHMGYVAIIRDISKRKEAEIELHKYQEQLEQKVELRTRKLNEVNTALEVLLQKRMQDKQEMERKILYNVKELILPGLKELKMDEENLTRTTAFELIESNLKDIISPFAHSLSSKKYGLTPTELKIANQIKHGLSTKELAENLNLSIHTIQFHRANIRKKLGISRSKTNLRAYFQIDDH